MIIATTAGALALGGLAVAAPALADPDPSAGPGTAAVERIRDALAGLVEDGSLTEEQADEVAATLAESGFGGHGGHPWRGLALETAATALDMTEDELRTALQEDGATLAGIAEEQGVPVEDLVAALVEAAQERIAQAVEDGRISQEQADARLGDLEERITEWVNADLPGHLGHGHGGRGPMGGQEGGD
jgi:polyhydroxyalkanoate synthesis regulator phasin